MDYLFDILDFNVRNELTYLSQVLDLYVCINLAIGTIFSLPSLESMNRKSFLNQFFSRYFRTVPVIMTVNFLFIILPFLVPRHLGPVSDAIIDYPSKICSCNFHKDLTMTANFGDAHETCNPVTWFISLDLQMFILFFIPLKILGHNHKKGLIIIAVMGAAGLMMYGLYLRFLIPDYLPTIMSLGRPYEYINERAEFLYLQPISYIGVKAVSIFIGCVIFRTRKSSPRNVGNQLFLRSNWLYWYSHDMVFLTPNFVMTLETLS